MINASQEVKDLLNKNISISTSAGSLIEYNLNTMVEYIDAKSNGTDHVLTDAFQKLFPIDTIYKPFRPITPGIKYFIYTKDNTTSNTDSPAGSFSTARDIDPDTQKPRLYYPGPDIYYKYWLGPKNTNIDISLEYFQEKDKINNKLIPANKIVARFETGHDTPSSWQIIITKQDGNSVTVSGSSLNDKGEAIVYYNGTNWLNTWDSNIGDYLYPESFSHTQYIKKVQLQGINSNSGKLLGVIELSPRWIIDANQDLESFSIQKETDAYNTELIPVGTLTANSLSISLNRLNQQGIKLKEYNRTEDIDNDYIYLFKNVLVMPYIDIKSEQNNRIYQGVFYMHSWKVSEFGQAEIIALDCAKILQETLCPDILAEDYPVTSIIRRLLDSIGFSNYQINVKRNSSGQIEDSSIPSVRYWWTENDKTVWEALQELCRDMQINAFVNEDNVLNFYTRDYIYDTDRDSNWLFTSETDSTTLPNIINFNSNAVASANEVTVLYSTPVTSEYDGGSSPLWKSEETYLGAGGLAVPLDENHSDYFNLEPNTIDTSQGQRVLYNLSGYVLVNDEIIEYDGAEYQYVPKEGGAPQEVLIKSPSDIYKWRSLSKAGYSDLNDPNSAYFKPTGRYKIKKRGALKTEKAAHKASPISYINESGSNDSEKFTKYSITLATAADAEEKPGSGSYKTPTNISSKTVAKSFLSLQNLDKNKTTFDIALKEYTALDTSSSFHAFGTRMFFDSMFESVEQVGGLAFFTNSTGTIGYYVIIRTTAAAGLKKDVRILKQSANGKIKVLKDSQTTSLNTLAGIYNGQAYNVDVIIKTETGKNTITVFINGFKIVAQDITSESNNVEILPLSPSKNVGLMCGQGVVYFEYLYANKMEESEYKERSVKSGYDYNGVYSDDTMSLLYGDLIYQVGETATKRKDSLVEFGTTAREIRKAKVRYTDRPAVAIRFSTAKNKYATILDTRLQPFSAETYVLNNTSTFIPLDDSNYSSFYVLGNSIQKSSQIEYRTDSSQDSKNIEPIIFESNWIQSESDAKSLAEWIKSTVLNKGLIIDMDVFGNPLISPGDIISIKYPLQGLDESKKYIVTRVSLEYREGLSTSISCRAI